MKKLFTQKGIRQSQKYSIAIALFVISYIITIFAFAYSSQIENSAPSTIQTINLSEKINDMATNKLITSSIANTITIQQKETIPLAVKTAQISETIITYTVKSGDCLWAIASIYYGNGSLYTYIAKENNLTSETIVPNMELIIPNINDSDIKSELDKKIETKTIISSKMVTTSKNNIDYSNMTFYSNCYITGYDPWCSHCCGKADGITASGVEAVVGVTCGMTNVKLGTKIYVEGYGYYTVQDTGNMNSTTVDIACSSHAECYKITGYANVYIVNN